MKDLPVVVNVHLRNELCEETSVLLNLAEGENIHADLVLRQHQRQSGNQLYFNRIPHQLRVLLERTSHKCNNTRSSVRVLAMLQNKLIHSAR